MKRKIQAQKIETRIKTLIKKNPKIKEALRVFGISSEQYQKTLQGGYSYYTSTSTSPAQVEFGSKHK